MSIQETKCPNCGATVFSQPTSDVNQPDSTIHCQYCNSQFRVSNPNYRVVQTTINTYHTTYESNKERTPRLRTPKDWEHKVTRVLGYIIGGLMAPVAFVCWIAWIAGLSDKDGLTFFIPVFFTGVTLFFLLLAYSCNKELKRRKAAGVSY